MILQISEPPRASPLMSFQPPWSLCAHSMPQTFSDIWMTIWTPMAVEFLCWSGRPLGHSTHFMQDLLDFSASQMHVLACMEQKSHDVTGCNTHILLLCPDLGHALILCVPLMYTTHPSQLHYLWLLTPLESLLLSGLIMSKVISSKPRSYCLSWAYIIQLVPSKSCY